MKPQTQGASGAPEIDVLGAVVRLEVRTGCPQNVEKFLSSRFELTPDEAYQCDAIIMRHPLDGSARFAADHVGVPVFNGGDGKHEHPTQTLLDLFTIREHLGRLDDIAGLAVYLASDASAYCSGGVYMVDGGYSVN